MDCEPGRMRAHARLTYILTGALHHFIEISVLNNKGKGKCSISGEDSAVDSIVEDAERLLLRAQAIAAYALRLDDRGNLVDGEPRTGVSPSAAEIEVPRPHTARPSLQIRPHKEALASIFSFSPLSLAPPSPPLTIEETVTAPSLSEPFQDCCPGAYAWPARLPPTPTSVKAIRRKPAPTTAASIYATGVAVRLGPPSFRRRPIRSAEEASKATLPPSGLPPTSPTPETVQQPHSTPWLRGVDEESVVDPLTGLPAQRTTGFEPGPSNRDPGPIKPDPFRNLPTKATPIYPTQLVGTTSNDWWTTQENPLLPPKSSTEHQEIGRVSGQFTDPPAYPLFPSSKAPDSWRSGPPSYVEFEQDNALDGNHTPHIEEDEQTKKGSLRHFLKTMRLRSQKKQTGSDAALAQRIQDEEDQIVSATVLPNHFDDPIQNMAGDTSNMSDRLLAQRLQEREEQLPQESSTQASCSSATLKKHMEADLKVARALQAEWEEEARQQEMRTLKELQAKFEEQDNQDARLAAKLAAAWEREDREESERVREQETTCIVCVERCKKSQLCQPCSDVTHIWCRKCLHAGFKTALQTKSRLRCCSNIATKSVPSLDPAFAKQYHLMLLEMDTPNPVYCSAKACGAFIPPPSVKGDIATCTKCKKRSCVHCRAGEHVGKICAQDEDTQRVLQLAKKKKWKQCPGCGNMIEKTEGCLHMTCSRCRGEFCYHCGQLWSKCKNQCLRGYT